MEILIGVALLVGIYAFGRATSSAHGHLATTQRELESVAASLRARTEESEARAAYVGQLRGDVDDLRAHVQERQEVVEQVQEQLDGARQAAEADKREAREALDALTADIDAQQKEIRVLHERAEVAEAALKEILGRSAGLSEDTLRAAEAFVAWCNQATPLVGRHYLFQRTLRRALPDAVVSPVYRSGSGGDGAEVAFKSAAEGAEYWLVQTGGERLLLPHPRTPDAFQELSPAFDGYAAPRVVARIAPARLSLNGDHLVLDLPGEVA